MWYFLLAVFYRFLDGLSSMGVLTAIRAHIDMFQIVFDTTVWKAAELKTMFQTVYTSAPGSNKYIDEMQRRAWFDDFLDCIECGL
jgi:hypothetical protein